MHASTSEINVDLKNLTGDITQRATRRRPRRDGGGGGRAGRGLYIYATTIHPCMLTTFIAAVSAPSQGRKKLAISKVWQFCFVGTLVGELGETAPYDLRTSACHRSRM